MPLSNHTRTTGWIRRRLLAYALGLLAGWCGAAARGQETVPTLPSPRPLQQLHSSEAPALTLADLENLAMNNNPTLGAAAALIQQEQGFWQQAGLYPNPTAGYIRDDPNKNGPNPNVSETQGVFLSQDIVTAGKLRKAQAAEASEIETRNWQLKAQVGRVLNDVRIRYFEVLGSRETVRAARELERLADEGVRVTEQRLKAKLGSRPDLLQAEIQLSLVRTTRQDAEYRATAAWQQLANVIGVLHLPPAPLAGQLEDHIPQLDWQENLQQLLAASPVLKAQAATVEVHRRQLKLARAQAVPNVSVQLVIQHDQVEKIDSVTSLVSLPVPFFNRNQGNIVNAQAQLAQQQKEYERIQLALSDQLAATFQQYQSSRNQVERLQQEILPRARENLDLTVRAYEAGQFDFLHVLSARQTYFQARLAYIGALTALHQVVIEIKGLELTGGLNPTEVGTALQMQRGVGVGPRNVLLQQLQQEQGGGSRNLPGAVTGVAGGEK